LQKGFWKQKPFFFGFCGGLVFVLEAASCALNPENSGIHALGPSRAAPGGAFQDCLADEQPGVAPALQNFHSPKLPAGQVFFCPIALNDQTNKERRTHDLYLFKICKPYGRHSSLSVLKVFSKASTSVIAFQNLAVI
jgi:hypothetical protein